MAIMFPSQEWIYALMTQLNQSKAYKEAASNWEGDFFFGHSGAVERIPKCASKFPGFSLPAAIVLEHAPRLLFPRRGSEAAEYRVCFVIPRRRRWSRFLRR